LGAVEEPRAPKYFLFLHELKGKLWRHYRCGRKKGGKGRGKGQ